MAQALLPGTDLLIDFLRGQRQAVAFMEEETRPMAVSALTTAELHAGVRMERKKINCPQPFELIPQSLTLPL